MGESVDVLRMWLASIGAGLVGQRRTEASLAATAGAKRDSTCGAQRETPTPRRFLKRYFLSGKTIARGPGSSNIRFRSRLRTI